MVHGALLAAVLNTRVRRAVKHFPVHGHHSWFPDTARPRQARLQPAVLLVGVGDVVAELHETTAQRVHATAGAGRASTKFEHDIHT